MRTPDGRTGKGEQEEHGIENVAGWTSDRAGRRGRNAVLDPEAHDAGDAARGHHHGNRARYTGYNTGGAGTSARGGAAGYSRNREARQAGPIRPAQFAPGDPRDHRAEAG